MASDPNVNQNVSFLLTLRTTEWSRDAVSGKIVSVACGRCACECVGSGFSDRFFSLHIWPREFEHAEIPVVVALCDQCGLWLEDVFVGKDGYLVRVMTRESGVCIHGVVDSVHREND